MEKSNATIVWEETVKAARWQGFTIGVSLGSVIMSAVAIFIAGDSLGWW